MNELRIIPWDQANPPTVNSIRQHLLQEGLSSYIWSNASGDTYPPHSHSYDKVLYVVQGSITWIIGDERQEYETRAGERIELPRGTLHAARVGSQGVTCIEAHQDG